MSPASLSEEEVFQMARRIESAEARRAYLDQSCRDDAALRNQVEALLAAYESSESFLESPAAEIAAEIPTRDQTVTERPGTVIGPYKLLQQIGEGGMGIVFMAEQSHPVHRTVALKIIKPGMDTRQVIARFEAERQALAMMDHPNIARVIDAGTTDTGRPYFVMDLVKGVPITTYCDEKHLSLRERLELFLPVCHAVQHAHQKGIIHRDIKPTNVLVAEYDNHAIPKIIDFGVAKATAHRLTERTMFTEFGQVLGTMEYMSPEQAKLNQLDIDTRSDIYSLGVLLYELLAGSTPFEGKRLHEAAFDEMLRIIREEEPPKPSTKVSSSDTLPSIAANRHTEPARLSKEVQGELDWIVMKALEKDRTRRFDTASKFAEDVQHYLNDEAVAACPPSAGYRFRKFARRNKSALTTAVVILLVLLSGVVVSTWQAIRATRAERLAAQRLTEANQARGEVEQERNRAEANLDLALQALDNTYQKLIGEDPLLSASRSNPWEGYWRQAVHRSLTDSELELLEEGLEFYGRFAQQNAELPAAAAHTAQAFFHMGLLQAALGKTERAVEAHQEAVKRFQKLTRQEPGNAEHFLALGDAQLGLLYVTVPSTEREKRGSAAVAAYTRAIDLKPGDASLYERRACAHKDVSNNAQAIADAQRAVELAPDRSEFNLTLARFFLSFDPPFRDALKALKYANRALEIDEQSFYAHQLLSNIYGGLDPQQFVTLNRTERALHHASRAMELAPDQGIAYALRSDVYRRSGEFDKALADANKAVELSPLDVWMWLNRANVYMDLGEHDKALDDIAASENLDVTDPLVYGARTKAYLAKGQYQDALDSANKFIGKTRLPSWWIYKRRAEAFFHLGRYDEALADLRTAIELNPNDTSTLMWIGSGDLANCPDEAFKQGLLQLAAETVERSNNSVDARCTQIELKLALGQVGFPEAIAAMSEAIARDPDHWLAYYPLALMQLSAGDVAGYRKTCGTLREVTSECEDPQAASLVAWTCALAPDAVDDYAPIIALAHRAVDASPNNNQYLKALAAILFRAGQVEAAITQLTDVAQREASHDRPSNTSSAYSQYFLAMAHHRQGNADEARECLDQAAERTEREIEDHAPWNRRLTLDLLRREATALIEQIEKGQPEPHMSRDDESSNPGDK